jgi:hypothetical protein
MKKIILLIGTFVFVISSYSQDTKENGTIYINHPYIKVVNNAMKAYLAKDDAANLNIYADTAKYWSSGMPKAIDIKEAIKMWDSDFDYYDSVKLTTVGYPDYLHYIDGDAKIVQSWWQWSGISKKTKEKIKVDFVQFDTFNKDGRIDFESIYGDFSKVVKD